jgi:hypothetical protein
MTACGQAAIIFWTVTNREASLSERKPAKEREKNRRRDDKRVDEESAESFPASDPPSYAGGPHAIGGPRRPKSREDKS